MLDDTFDLPPILPDESAIAASEFHEAVREELLEAANTILEKLAGIDDFDLALVDCTVTCAQDGHYRSALLKVAVHGRTLELAKPRFASASRLSEQLERLARLKWEAKRDRLGRLKSTRPEGLAGMRQSLRMARTLLALRDAVARHPGAGEPNAILDLVDTLRRCVRRDDNVRACQKSAQAFIKKLGEAAELGGARGSLKAYGPMLLTPKAVASLAKLPVADRKDIQKALVKVRDKVKEEAEKNGLLGLGSGEGMGVGPAGNMDLDLPPLPPLPPLDADDAGRAGDDLM